MEEETIEGIEKQYNDVVHYVEDKELEGVADSKVKPAPRPRRDKKMFSEISSANEPRNVSSRGSSRMLFADLNVEDLE